MPLGEGGTSLYRRKGGDNLLGLAMWNKTHMVWPAKEGSRPRPWAQFGQPMRGAASPSFLWGAPHKGLPFRVKPFQVGSLNYKLNIYLIINYIN